MTANELAQFYTGTPYQGKPVKEIAEGAFKDCKYFTSVTIPDSVTTIGNSAFSGCTGLTTVNIGNGVTKICNSAFRNCGFITNMTIPESLINIEQYALYGCDLLEEITFNGTKKQWYTIEKTNWWDKSSDDYKVHCTDGTIESIII